MTFEDRYQSFAQYLKNRQLKIGVPEEFLNDIPDEDILLSYRRNFEDGSSFFTVEQERSVLMEYSSNDAIFEALEGIKRQNHIESVEKEFIKEFPGLNRAFSSADINLTKILIDFEKIGIKIKLDDIDEVIKEGCSVFAEWIFDSRKYYLQEYEDFKFKVDADFVCTACFLNETLHKHRTLLGWSFVAVCDEADDKKLKNCNEMLITYIRDYLFFVISRENPEPDDRYGKRFINLMSHLFGLIYDYMSALPLISCWLIGKDIAQKRMEENEENGKFLEDTHVHFCKKYSCSVKIEDQDQFVVDLNEYLKSLSLEQLKLLQMGGFPIEMPKKLSRKIKGLIEIFLNKANQQMAMINGK